jgi:hypothetical protein
MICVGRDIHVCSDRTDRASRDVVLLLATRGASSEECHGEGMLERAKGRRMIMPEFGSPFSGLANDRKLTDQELIRAIRFMIAAEYEAIQLYMQLAESTDHKLAIEVLRDIADEERVHAGEFLRLLHELSPDEERFYAEGTEEVEEEIKKLE